MKEAEGLWYCREDIASNRIRARFGALDTALKQEVDETAHTEATNKRDALVEDLRGRLKNADSGGADTAPATYADTLVARVAELDVRLARAPPRALQPGPQPLRDPRPERS